MPRSFFISLQLIVELAIANYDCSIILFFFVILFGEIKEMTTTKLEALLLIAGRA